MDNIRNCEYFKVKDQNIYNLSKNYKWDKVTGLENGRYSELLSYSMMVK